MLALTLALTIAAPQPKPAKPDLSTQLPGSWICTKMTFFGKDVPAEAAPRMTFTAEGKMTHVWPTGKRAEEAPGAYKLDTTKNPTHIDFDLVEKDKTTTKMLGILKLDGDKLVISMGAKRPETFDGTKDESLVVMVMERVKKDK